MKVIGFGRLSADPELRRTASGKAVCHATVASDRAYKNSDGTRTADFVDLLMWGNTAEQFAKYLSKGRQVYVVGELENNKFLARDGTKRNRWEVLVEEWRFLDKAENNPPDSGYNGYDASQSAKPSSGYSGYGALDELPVVDEADDDLPF